MYIYFYFETQDVKNHPGQDENWILQKMYNNLRFFFLASSTTAQTWEIPRSHVDSSKEHPLLHRFFQLINIASRNSFSFF